MRRSLLPSLLLVAAAAAGCASSTPPGGPPPLDAAALKKIEADSRVLWDEAVALRDAKKHDAARRRFTRLLEDYPGSPLAAEAQFQAAECAWAAERWFAAGELYVKYVEDRPLNSHLETVEQRLYQIGDRLIVDGKRGLWGTGIFTTSEEGVDVLRRLATLLPTGKLADDALMRIGRHYAEQRDYVGAESTLQELIESHPASEWRLQARFLVAWAYREDNRGPAYDGEKLKRARAHFCEYLAQATRDPDRAAEYAAGIEAARKEIEAIDADMARKAILRARYYRRSGRPAAAVAVLREAARQWGSTEPGQECAAQARELAAELGMPEEETPPSSATPGEPTQGGP